MSNWLIVKVACSEGTNRKTALEQSDWLKTHVITTPPQCYHKLCRWLSDTGLQDSILRTLRGSSPIRVGNQVNHHRKRSCLKCWLATTQPLWLRLQRRQRYMTPFSHLIRLFNDHDYYKYYGCSHLFLLSSHYIPTRIDQMTTIAFDTTASSPSSNASPSQPQKLTHVLI